MARFAISDYRITINDVIERGFIFGVLDLAQIAAAAGAPRGSIFQFELPISGTEH